MAIEATGSKHNRNSNYLIVAICIFVALYCLYDGWLNEKFQQENTIDGKPNVTLLVNRIWLPIICGAIAAYSLISALRVAKLKIMADEQGLSVSGCDKIAYDSIKKIDKRYFEKEGYFTIAYTRDGDEKKLKLTDRKYSNLAALLDELVSRTGAAPVKSSPDQAQGDKES